jgi:hypothetical protein
MDNFIIYTLSLEKDVIIRILYSIKQKRRLSCPAIPAFFSYLPYIHKKVHLFLQQKKVHKTQTNNKATFTGSRSVKTISLIRPSRCGQFLLTIGLYPAIRFSFSQVKCISTMLYRFPVKDRMMSYHPFPPIKKIICRQRH